MRGELLEPWDHPFGVAWLTFDELAIELSLDSASAAAKFTSELQIVDRDATLTFELRDGEAGSGVELTATLDRLTAAEVIDFLADQLGATLPPAAPDLALSDIVLSVRTGRQSSVAFAASAEVAGQQVDVLLSTISQSGAHPAVVLGVQLDEWVLAEAVPELQGTLLNEIRFPPTALVLSTLEAELAAADLSAPVRSFFGQVAGGARGGSSSNYELDLRPGLSIFSSISFAGTDLEAPMEALGFSGANFPIVGTLPGSVLGLGGGGASVLDDLALSVALPSIAPPGSPEWFQSGRVSFVITGQPSLGLEGELTVVVDGEVFTFVVDAQFARVGGGVTISLFGALETDRPWEQPFSIEWLTLNRVAVELSVDAIGSVGLGFAGSMILGEKDIDVAVKLEVSPAGVPTNFILAGASAEGVSTNDLILLQRQIAQAANPGSRPLGLASDQPELSVRNIEFRFAPKASPVLDVEAGFVLAGDAFVAFEAGGPATRFGFLDFRITEDGLFALGHLTAYDLGPLAWDDIDLDVEASLADQHFFFGGAVEVFGARTQISINISTRSIFFAGQRALEDLRLIVDAFEVFISDPFGSVDKLPLLFEQLGVPQSQWVRDLVVALQQLADAGQQASTVALDTLLNGGSIPLIAFPVGGAEQVCGILTPIEIGDRCYTLPPAESPGVPLGGTARVCPLTSPQTHSDGRCYTTKPSTSTIETCPLAQPFKSGGRCYFIVPSLLDSNGTPNGGVAPNKTTVSIPGIPSGGRAKDACPITAPIKVGTRCYTIPPGEILRGTPEGGATKVCGVLVGRFENGRCWTVSPSEAAAGLAVPGLCKTYANISCSWEQLTSRDLRPLLVEGLVERLSFWE